jgi:hypothetical protein
MSLGLAIFLSVLALLVVWQIDKRGAWGTFWRVAKWLFGTVLLAAGAFGAWLYWVTATNEREARAKVRAVRDGEVREYWGIKLGAGKNEVLYLKGEPSARNDEGNSRYWDYDDGARGYWQIVWSRQGTVVMISCNADGWLGCDSIAGVSIGTSEEDIRKTLGEPREESGLDAKGRKRLDYGTDDSDVRFVLEKSTVRMMAVRAASE